MSWIICDYEVSTSNDMSEIEEGQRVHFENGFQVPSKMTDAAKALVFIKYQRALVESLGCCKGGCKPTRIINHHATGKQVCCMTLEPCPKLAK